MEGVRGYTWAIFEEKAREIESLSGWPPSRKPLSPNAGRLCREDMAIYGEEPAIDSLSLVVCGECDRVVKSQALLQHIKHYHADTVHIPAPHSVAPPPLGGVHTIGQPSSAASTNDSSLSGYHRGGASAGVTGFTASQLPTSSGGGIGRSNKEYDPNKHCGVWISENQRHCTHSLTCKEHPVSERRKVLGRSRTFDELLDEHKKKKKMRKLEKLKSDADVFLNQQSSSTSHPHSPPLRSPTRSSRFELSSPSGGEATGGRREGGGGRGETTMTSSRTSAPSTPAYPKSNDLDDFPRPLAVCSFGSRSQLSGGLLRFSRKQDNLRSALAHLSGRSQDYTQTTLHRKHSYNSLLEEKRSQRKYFKPQQQASTIAESATSTSSSSQHHPSSLSLPLNPKPFPPATPTSSQPQPTSPTSPLYLSTILANLSRGTAMPFFSVPPTTQTGEVGGSTSSQQNPSNPPLTQSQPMQPVQTPSMFTPQRVRGASVSAMMTTPESVLNLGLANGDMSRESMDTDLETPLPSAPQGVGAGMSSSSLVNSPTTATTAPAPAQTSNRRSGKKKKKRGRKPKDKSQVDSSATVNSTQGSVESGGVHVQQPNAVDQNRTPVGGAVVGGVTGHHAHAGDDALRTSREQMEVESRRSIGSSSSISVPPLPSHNPHHFNNSYAGGSSSGNQAQLASETGQSRLTDHHRTSSTPSGVTTPSRESAGVVGGLPLGVGGVVRIKQEPITNHEEEMETNQPTAHQHQRQPTTTKSQSVVLNGMVTPPSGSGSPSLHPSFGSQTFVINPTGQHSSPGGHPLMTSLSPHMGGLLPIRTPQLFSTSTGLIPTAHQLQMLQQRTALIQQLHAQQQQQMLQAAAAAGGGGGGGSLSSPQSSMSLGSNSRTSTNPMQNSITAGGGLVMTASGHGFQHSFHVAQGGTESSSLRGASSASSSGGVNRIRAPISHIPSGNPTPYQDQVRTMPRLNALSQSTNKSLLHQGKQSLNSHSQQVT